MPMKFLGKMLFPRQQEWLQRRQAKQLVGVLVVAIVCGGIIVAIMFYAARKH
jgi:hypothetical protein